MDLIESLNWRYATKQYSPRKLSTDKLDTILEAVRLSASSGGLQPYRLLVVEDPKIRQQLQPVSYNPQITQASHLVVFAALEKVSLEHVEQYLEHVAQQRNISLAELDADKASLIQFVLSRPDDVNFKWATNQAYIGLGTALVAAAVSRVDATPMEGFDAVTFDQVLQLKAHGLRAVLVLALGYRDEQDLFATLKKARLPRQEFVIEL